MNLTRAVGKGLVFPPSISGEIQIALIGPTMNCVNIVGFSSAGRAGDDELDKFQTSGQLDSSDELEIFNGNKYVFKWITQNSSDDVSGFDFLNISE